MPSAEFENWWVEVQREPGALSNSLETARRIGRRLRLMEPDEQQAYLDQLMQVLLQRHRSYGIALFLLEGISDPASLTIITEHLLPLPGLVSDDEEAHLADLIRILAAADEPGLLPAVETYLLSRDIGPHWASVPWALWPHRQELFAKAWWRFFLERDPTTWSNTLVIKSFLGEVDAILTIKDQLAERSPERWSDLRKALLRQAGSVSWLSPDQLSQLEHVLS